MNPDPEKATELAPGVTLFTKDGSKLGNAIVVNQVARSPDPQQKAFMIEVEIGDTPPSPQIYHSEVNKDEFRIK